jgi:hypothetical protein
MLEELGLKQLCKERSWLIIMLHSGYWPLELSIGFCIAAGKGICLQLYCNIIVVCNGPRSF